MPTGHRSRLSSGDGRVARLLDRGLLVAVDDVLLSVVCETDEV